MAKKAGPLEKFSPSALALKGPPVPRDGLSSLSAASPMNPGALDFCSKYRSNLDLGSDGASPYQRIVTLSFQYCASP